MNRNVDIKEISDGRTYQENDMVRADCGGCKGCSACCRDMVDTIILDPLDIFRLSGYLSLSFDEMLEEQITLSIYDGLILPHLLMSEKTGGCPFLDEKGRCRVHPVRPGFCRIFPLGRYYEKGDYSYILQVHECPRPKTKIKVKKWIDTPEPEKNRRFINAWHDLQKDMQERLPQCPESMQKSLTLTFLQLFYRKPYTGEDFYPEFEERLQAFKGMLI